jgi:hypothetical protein
MRSRAARWSGRSLILLFAGAAGCGGDANLSGPGTTGTLEITTSTSGPETDPDGYTVQVDGDNGQAIGSAATISRSDISAGSHTVQLAGLAANCSVTGENPRNVSVTAGQTMAVTFEVICGASSGGLQVTTSTTGPAPDADGYAITVDGSERGIIGASAGSSLDGIAAGQHEIGLSGVAGNCTVGGDNPQIVTVTPGASATVTFTVTCAAPPANAGSLRISTATSGADPDANGYRFAVDGGSAQPIGVNSSTTVTNVGAGSHSVRLSGLSGNCKVQGANPRSIIVAGGATAEASFAISCSATSGSLQISTSTTGSNPDPDGYTVSVDGGAAQPIGVNATLPVAGVPAGAHQVALSGLASNCSVQGDNPKQVTVSVGASASVAFTITCSTTTGSSWAPMASGTNTFLEFVSGSSASNVFAAGQNLGCNTSNCGVMTILHYNGTGWATQYTHGGGVRGLWAAPSGQAFALAEGPFSGPLLYYDGQQWSAMAAQPPAPVEPDEISLNAIWGTSATDVFAVGEKFTGIGNSLGYIVHYNGTQWAVMNLPNADYLRLSGIWGSAPTDVYVVAQYVPYDSEPTDSRAVILHYDGQAWSEVLREPNLNLDHIWGSSATDVFATGSTVAPGGATVGAIWHFDGTRWSAVSIPQTPALYSVWGSSSRDVYVLALGNGPFNTSGNIWHFDGTSWTEIKTKASGLLDIWGSSATDIFAVGADGTILHGPR